MDNNYVINKLNIIKMESNRENHVKSTHIIITSNDNLLFVLQEYSSRDN